MAGKDEVLSETFPRLYLAYGSNLSLTQMRSRCPSAIYVGVAMLEGWRWLIGERGYANIVPIAPSSAPDEESRHVVYGLVYTLTTEDEARLDTYEGVPWAYQKDTLTITLCNGGSALEESGQLLDALVYVDKIRTGEGVVRDEYVVRMRRGVQEAKEKGLPIEWMNSSMSKWFKPEV